MITKKFIINAIQNNYFRITSHATTRRLERSIRLRDVKSILLNGEIIQRNNKALPYPTAVVLGFTQSGDPIHIVISKSDCPPELRIVTVYEPLDNLWNNAYTKKRMKGASK